MVKKKKGLLFCTLLATVCTAAAAATFSFPAPWGADAAQLTESGVLTDCGDDAVISARTLSRIDGKRGEDYSAASTWSGMVKADDDTGSADGKVVKAPLNGWGAAFLETVDFENYVHIDDVGTLTFRIYAYFSSGTSYDISQGGVRLYKKGATGKEMDDSGEYIKNYYLIPSDVTQNTWTDLTLTKEQASALADADGYIKGFTVGNLCNFGNGAQFYPNSPTPYLLVDSVSYSTALPVESSSESSSEVNSSSADEPEEFIPTQVTEGVLTSGEKVNFTAKTLTHIDGMTGANKGGQFVYRNITAETDDTGSADGKVLKASIYGWGGTIFNTVHFENYVHIDDIDTLTMRVFAHFSEMSDDMPDTKDNYETAFGGVRLYKIGATGNETNATGQYLKDYYMIPADIKQDTWTDLTLNKSELKAFADENGYIKGFTLGNLCNFSSLGFYSDSAYLLIDSVECSMQGIDGDATVDEEALEALINGGGLLTAPIDGWYTQTAGTLKYLNGKKAMTSDTATVKGGPSIVAAAGAVTGNAFRYQFHSWGTVYNQTTVQFKNTIALEDLGALVIRMRAHLSAASTYTTAEGGIRLYGLGDTGQLSPGWLVPTDVKQDEWIEIILSKDEAAVLATDDGNGNKVLSGLQVGAMIKASNNDLFYIGTNGEPSCGWIEIDYINASTNVDVQFTSDGSVLQENSYYTGTTIKDGFIPEKAGYIFCGWYNGSEIFNFNNVVTEDMTLTAKWAAAGSVINNAGLYYYENGEGMYATNGQYLYLDENGNIDLSDMKNINPVLVGITAEKVVIVVNEDLSVDEYPISADGFVKVTDFKTVTYEMGNRTLIFRIKTGETLVKFTPERVGYEFVHWANTDEDTFDFAAAINADTVITAVWDYVEISENLYAFYNGTFYCKETDTFLVLAANHNATLGNESVQYYILDAGIIVLKKNGVDTEYGILPQRITDEAGNAYYRLATYYITFETKGGSDVATITVEGNGWKATKPADPTKAGATFLGWTMLNGEAFDFDQVITRSVTLYATWSTDGTVDSTVNGGADDNGNNAGNGGMAGCSCGAEIGSIGGVAGLLTALAGVVFINGKRRKTDK